MTSAHSTFEGSVASAEASKAATLASAETSRQTTITGSGCDVGYRPTNGSSGNGYAAYAIAVASANSALISTRAAAEAAKQLALAAARETLRAAAVAESNWSP